MIARRGWVIVPEDRVEGVIPAVVAVEWAAFWDGHLDLDALAADVTEHLTDLSDEQARVARVSAQATRWWEHPCCRVPMASARAGVSATPRV